MKAYAMILVICGVILAVLFAGCTTQLPANAPLIGKWTLVSAPGWGGTNVTPVATITAIFSDKTVSGSAGCNNYVAAYTVQNTKLTIEKPETSNKSCDSPPGIMDQETIYLSNLQGAASYAISGDTLTLYDTMGKTLLTYQKAGV
jgi:heat shock protein HslJ